MRPRHPSLPPPVVYREGVVGTPTSITPLSARNRAERSLVGLVFSGLMRMGPQNTLEPDLASSYKLSDDGKTWTFHIRDDAVWQDGEPVTSADVLYTVAALKDPDASGGRSGSWAEVETAALDDKTVTFRLTTPVGGFLAATTQPLLPAHLLGETPYADIATSEFARRRSAAARTAWPSWTRRRPSSSRPSSSCRRSRRRRRRSPPRPTPWPRPFRRPRRPAARRSSSGSS